MQLDTHVKGLLDTLAASGQPRCGNSHRLRRARWPLGSRRWSRGRSRSASSKTDHCRGRQGHCPSASTHLSAVGAAGAAPVHRLFPWRRLDLWQLRYARLHVPYARQRERLSGHLQLTTGWHQKTSFLRVLRMPMLRPSGWRQMHRKLASTQPGSPWQGTQPVAISPL